MIYGFIVVGGAIFMTIMFVFTTGASAISKAAVVALLTACLGCVFWLHRYPLAVSFALVGLGIYITFYRIGKLTEPADRDK